MKKIINNKILYMLFLVLIILLGLVISPTYAKFADSYITEEDIVVVSLDFNIGISNLEEYEEIEVGAYDVETFNVEIENISSNTLYYGIWYRMVEPTTKDSNIIIARLQDTDSTTSGSINSNGTKTVSIVIDNNTDSNIKVDIGVLSSDISTSNIEYLSGKRLISGISNYNLMKNSSTDNFRSDTYKTYIKNATFVDYIDTSNASLDENSNIISWDMSKDNNKSIIAWLEDNEADGYYDLYIGSNRKIYAKELSYFFRDMSSLVNVNFDNLNTSITTNMVGMFGGCSSLITLDLSNFNTSNVTSMGSTNAGHNGMFAGCSSLVSLDLSSFDTSKVTNMAGMFEDCSSLTNIDLNNFDTSNVIYMGSNSTGWPWAGMFEGCSSLVSLDLSSFDTSNVVAMNRMFWGCSNLEDIILTNKFDTSKVTLMKEMFYQCNKLINLNLSGFDTSNVIDMTYMFYSCSALQDLDLSTFNTSKVTNMVGMFAGCSSLISLDLSNFNTSNVTSMGATNGGYNGMFAGCSSLISLDLSSFDTSKVTNMAGMFEDCSSLISLDLSKFDTSNVIYMGSNSAGWPWAGMFEGCSSLVSLDLSSFDTSNVVAMNRMFYDCVNLENIIFTDKFNTSKVTLMDQMFYNCSKLTATLTVSSATTTYRIMFTNAATATGAKITVNYISGTSSLVDNMIATKSTNSNVVKGSLVE